MGLFDKLKPTERDRFVKEHGMTPEDYATVHGESLTIDGVLIEPGEEAGADDDDSEDAKPPDYPE